MPDQMGFWPSRDGYIEQVGARYVRKAGCSLDQGKEAAALGWAIASNVVDRHPGYDPQAVIDAATYKLEHHAAALAANAPPADLAQSADIMRDMVEASAREVHAFNAALDEADTCLASVLDMDGIDGDSSRLWDNDIEAVLARATLTAANDPRLSITPEAAAHVEAVAALIPGDASEADETRHMMTGEDRRSPYDRATATLDTSEARAARMAAQQGKPRDDSENTL